MDFKVTFSKSSFFQGNAVVKGDFDKVTKVIILIPSKDTTQNLKIVGVQIWKCAEVTTGTTPLTTTEGMS